MRPRPRSGPARRLPGLLLALLPACRPDADPCAAELSPVLAIGVGATDFTAVEDDGELPFVRGPQGGYHVVAALRAEGIHAPGGDALVDPDNPHVTYTITGVDRPLGGYVDAPRPFLADGEAWLLLNELLVLDVQAPEEIDGTDATVEAAVEDVCGRVAEDTHPVHLRFAGDA